MLRENFVKKCPSELGVIFDFDGTLVDSFTHRGLAHIEAARILVGAVNKQGFEVPEDELILALREIEKEMTAKRIYDRKFWFSEALTRQGLSAVKVPQNVLSEAVLGYWETIIRNSFLYPGVTELLTSIRKKAHLGLISDTDGLEGMKLRRIHESKLERYFEKQIISGEDTEELKPNKQPFAKICEGLDISPTNCIYIGDNPAVDVAGAKEIGMKTLLIRNSGCSFNSQQVGADYLLDRDRFNQIESVIFKQLGIPIA